MSEGDQLATCGSKAFLKEPIRNEARNRFSSRRTFRKSDVGDIAATNTGSTTAPSAHSVRRQAGSGKQLERKLRGYLNPAARFLIMRDQDSHADCKALKKTLLAKCCRWKRGRFLGTNSVSRTGKFLFGRPGGCGVCILPGRTAQISGEQQNTEILTALVPQARNSMNLQVASTKSRGSRALGSHLDLENTRSNSFSNLIQGIRRLERQLLD
jgi:hypothetical protein